MNSINRRYEDLIGQFNSAMRIDDGDAFVPASPESMAAKVSTNALKISFKKTSFEHTESGVTSLRWNSEFVLITMFYTGDLYYLHVYVQFLYFIAADRYSAGECYAQGENACNERACTECGVGNQGKQRNYHASCIRVRT